MLEFLYEGLAPTPFGFQPRGPLAGEKARMLARLRTMAESGPPHNVKICHQIEGDVWQIESGHVRVLWFYDEGASHVSVSSSTVKPRSGAGCRFWRTEMTKSFAALFEAAERHDEYWTELAIIEFTEALSRWMEEKKTSQAELAAAVGVSQPYISKVLKGNANFTLATMTKLAHALGARVHVQLVPMENEQTKAKLVG